MLPLSGNASYLVSQAPKAKPALGLLTPNKIEWMAPANQVFSIFLFLVLSSLPYKSFLLSAIFYNSLKGDYPLPEVLNTVCLYHLNCL